MKKLPLIIVALSILATGYFVFSRRSAPSGNKQSHGPVNAVLAAQFDTLSKKG